MPAERDLKPSYRSLAAILLERGGVGLRIDQTMKYETGK